MRDIKFKIWDKAREEIINDVRLSGMLNRKFKCDNLVFLQYTGLKDKNGVEIYEGDIVKSKCYPFYSDAPEMEGGKAEPVELNYLGVAGIDVDGVYYDLRVVSDRVSGRATGGQLSDLDDVEVVGNIYENPELIGEL